MKWWQFLLFLLFYTPAPAQPLQRGKVESTYTYRHFTIADGLPQIQITSLFCDSKGFVWVGTKFGIARWDGKQFKVFTPKEGAAGRQAIHFTETDRGDIVVAWHSPAFNIIRGDVIETITLPVHWNATNVSHIFPADSNRIFLCTTGFSDEKNMKYSLVSVFNLETNRFEREIWMPLYHFLSITKDGYIVTADYNFDKSFSQQCYLYRYNRFIKKVDVPGKPTGLNFSRFPAFNYYINNDLSVKYSINVVNDEVRFVPEKTNIRQQLSFHNAQYVYTTPEQKSYFQDSLQQLVEESPLQKRVLANLPAVSFMIKDKEQNLWAATENGLYCFYKLAMAEYRFNFLPGTLDAVWSMAKTSNGNWYYSSYEKGFFKSIDNNQTWQRISEIDKTKPDEFMRKGSYGTIALRNGGLILTANSGFNYINGSVFRQYNLFGKGADVFSCWEDTLHNRVLISKYTYLFSFDLKTLQLDTLLKLPYNGLQTILNILPGVNNKPVLTGKGVPLHYNNGNWQQVKGAVEVRSIGSFIDEWGGLWLGEPQRLTCVRNGKSFSMKKFPGRQLVLSITSWKKKWLVIGGGFEIIFFDLEIFYRTGKEIYQRFDAGSGFTTTEGGQNSLVHDSDGSIWWPCQEKIIRFWPEKLLGKTAMVNSPELFTATVSGKGDSSLYFNGKTFQEVFQSNKEFRNLRFAYGTAAMNNYDNLVYRYRLIGHDTNWSLPVNSKVVVFNNLKPGTYRFQVQSSFDAVNWSATTSSSQVKIQGYWYETMMFKIAILFGVIGFASLITYYFSKQHRKGLERRKLMNELQLKAIRGKAIPHFSGNAFANIDFYIEKGDTENASRYLAILSRLHNITLADSDKSARTLDEELAYLKLYLEMEKLRFEERISYKFEIAEDVNNDIMVPNMILHTYAENAIKHGLKNISGHGCIKVTAYKENAGTWLKVSDNGIGRKESILYNKDSTKQGLLILNKQIELYNISNKRKIQLQTHDLYKDDKTPAGTVFSVFIPDNFIFNS